MEVSDKKVAKIREHFIKDYNLKQIFIFNSVPFKRKQYIVDLLEVNKELAENMKKHISEDNYKKEVELIGYEEVDELPTYNYKCEDCGYQFSKMQKISEEPLEECPECRGSIKRIFKKAPGISFKGKNFYVNS
jgi:putative FmdB family regulatory protein